MTQERWGRDMPPGAPLPPVPKPVVPRSPVRWGIGDFFLVWLAQLVGAIVAEIGVYVVSGVDDELSTAAFFGVVVPAQAVAGIAAAVLVVRAKGLRGLGDLNWSIRWRDWSAFPAGIGLQVVFGFLLWPFAELLSTDEPAQELIQTIEDTEGALVWLAIFVGVVLLQPLLEEIMFRGLLLRALLRRTNPTASVLISGGVFGVVHVFGTGFDLHALPTIVGLGGLGVVLGVQALRHGSLGRPILTHMGFNLLTVAALLAS